MAGRADSLPLGSAARAFLPRNAGLVNAGMSAVDRLAIVYLAVPVAIFFFVWFKPLYGIPLGLASLAGIPSLFPLRFGRISERTWLAAAIVAAAWTLLGGAGHFFFANYYDWHVRDAVLRDLAVLPAVLGRIAGLRNADWFLFLWTFAGVFMFMLQVLAGERRWKAIALILATVVLYSGMDILLTSLSILSGSLGSPAAEAQFFVYRSDTSALLWVPNDALPGWLAIVLIYRCRDDPRFLSLAAWVGALTLLWAPLVSIGLLPFFLALAWRQLVKGRWLNLISPWNLVAGPLVFLGSALYLTADVGVIPAGSGAALSSWAEKATFYVESVLVDFLLLAFALWRSHRDGIEGLFFWIAILCLLAIPFFPFGPNNDLALDGSIPALVAIMFAVVDGWARPAVIGGRGLLVTVMLVIGALDPLWQLHRAASWPSWKPDLQRNVIDASEGGAHYVASLPLDSPLMRLLRPAASP